MKTWVKVTLIANLVSVACLFVAAIILWVYLMPGLTEQEPVYEFNTWYDEELRIGHDQEHGYYYVRKWAEDFTEDERQAWHIDEDYEYVVSFHDNPKNLLKWITPGS